MKNVFGENYNETLSSADIEKRKQEDKRIELNSLDGLRKESRELLSKAENIICFDNYKIFTIGELKYLYCSTNETVGLMWDGFELFNQEIIKNNFDSSGLWDYYKEPKKVY